MTPEEKAVHENGVRLLNQMSGSIFFYEAITPVELVEKLHATCAECYGLAEHIEYMKNDDGYQRFVCTVCRGKLIWKSYQRWLKKRGRIV